MHFLLRTGVALGALALLPPSTLAQPNDRSIDPAGPAAPYARPVSQASPAFGGADCASGTEIFQNSGPFIYGNGDTASNAGTAQELGQTFTAPCDGVLTEFDFVYQPFMGNSGTTVAGEFTLYVGEGTATPAVRTVPFSFTVPPAGSAYLLAITFEEYPVVEGQRYSVFLNMTQGNIYLQGSNTDPYGAGRLLVSGSGGPTGAGLNSTIDLRFFAVFDPPFTAEQAFSFEDAPGTDYTLTGAFDDGSFDYFDRFAVPSPDGGRDVFSNFDGDFAIFGQDIDGDGGSSTGVITIPDIDIAEQSGVAITASFGALNDEANGFDNYEAADGDGIEIYATVDGGARRLIGKFSPPAVGANGAVGAGDLYRDSDFDGVGEGSRLTRTLSDSQFNLGQQGESLTLEIEVTSTSGFEVIVVDDVRVTGTVPVELTAFDAVIDGRDVLLSWATASETNNAGFHVEARSASADWQRLAFVDGYGTTAEAQTYRFRAQGLTAGTHVFRLRQVDLDGTATLTQEVEVAIGVSGVAEVSAVGPNPVQDVAALTVAVTETQRVTVGVYDVLGRLVATPFDGALEAGTGQQVALDARRLAPGTYVLRVAGETFQEAQRFTVAR
jgi:hypothetical protein